jgi:Terpene cyclase DEP1
MKPKVAYLILCIVGTVLPYSQFLPFLRENGLDARLFVEELFANRISGFFGLDVIVSSVVLWVFVLVEGRRTGVKPLWPPIAASLAVGVSLGLPLFLYMREVRVERRGSDGRRMPQEASIIPPS